MKCSEKYTYTEVQNCLLTFCMSSKGTGTDEMYQA